MCINDGCSNNTTYCKKMCRKCYMASHKVIRHCSKCKKEISRYNKTGLCHTCIMSMQETRSKIGEKTLHRNYSEQQRKEISEKIKLSLLNTYSDPEKRKHIASKKRQTWANKVGLSIDQMQIKKKLKKNIRAIIYHRLKDRGSTKFSAQTFKILGYTVDDLYAHLESQFYDNPETGEHMSWDNYNQQGWHIDHIKPDSWFDYTDTDSEAFKQCWALSNLQPMWAKENLQKSNYYEGR